MIIVVDFENIVSVVFFGVYEQRRKKKSVWLLSYKVFYRYFFCNKQKEKKKL